MTKKHYTFTSALPLILATVSLVACSSDKSVGVDLVVFNHALAPSQERNLEREFQCRVLDRTGLILDIFSQRARSFEDCWPSPDWFR